MRPELPSGTVTFVFTDVEGSTSLLNELGPEAYAESLAAHRAVIREACIDRGGVEVDTQGDAFFFAFPTAPGALGAASDLTGRLAADGPIRVRVGVHTGTPFVGEEGYVGHDVHRAARIAAAGHGGQVLVSAATAALVDTELTDLGEHRFKDLAAPERVFQLGHDEFPGLKTLYRTNLPVPATPFLGRQQELREVVELLGDGASRLLTLTGAGGTGKTRLMLQAAAELSDDFPDGVLWIPLAPLREEAALAATFAQALEVGERPDLGIGGSIVAAFTAKRALLVVDNCEHLLDAAAEFVRRLIEGCASLVVLASSRERLGLRAERTYEVPPMAPEDGHGLFVERARAVDARFRTDENVIAICEAVDDLPLAIELAAARVRSLSTGAIRERLTERLGLLISRNRDVDERQRTLEATIAWSYDLLDEEEQRVLRGLSVFAGGCTLAAAEAIAEADLGLVESLLDKSLLRHRIDETGHDRYWMLETVREYARRELDDRGEAQDVEARHTQFFLELAGQVLAPAGRPTTDAQRERFIRDRSNLREAHARCLAAGDASSALRFVRSLGRVANMTGTPASESYETGLACLALAGGSSEDRAYALVRTASFADQLGEFQSARALLLDAESIFESLGDARGRADAIAWRAEVEYRSGSFGQAAEQAERLAQIGTELGDADIESWAELLLSGALLGRAIVDGDREAAERSHQLVEAQVRHWAEYDSAIHRADMLGGLASTLFALEEYAESILAAQRGLSEVREIAGRTVTDLLFALALSLCGDHDHVRGITLLTAAVRLYSDEGIVREPWSIPVLDRFENNARAALGDDGYDAAVRAGEALSREKAIELALSVSAGG